MRSRSLFTSLVLLLAVTPLQRGAVVAAASVPPYLRPVKGAILRHFEPPPTPYAAGHRGIDMRAAVGTTVVAANDGVVAFAGPVAGRLFVSIDHADGIRTTYSFLSAVLVKRGQTVKRRDPVALSGTGDGSSPEPHLHFGARIGESYIDPEPLLLDGLRRDLTQVIHLAPDAA